MADESLQALSGQFSGRPDLPTHQNEPDAQAQPTDASTALPGQWTSRFADVHLAERRQLNLPEDLRQPAGIGVALSGGGIRSASFALGVLQVLLNEDLLRRFDYLSTVSGGGYLGSAVSWWLHQAAHAPSVDLL
jgi:hypothetical protein